LLSRSFAKAPKIALISQKLRQISSQRETPRRESQSV
jgi:hypothetical protein